MNKILDNIVDALISVLKRRNSINDFLASFLDRGTNRRIVFWVLLFIPFLIGTIFLYNNYQNLYLTFIPIALFCSLLVFSVLTNLVTTKFKKDKSVLKNQLEGFNLDLNTLVFKKLYNYLVKYEYVNENLTNYQDFFDVMTLDFDHHESLVHFDMNLAELKYLLDKFKKLKKGLTLTAFERSNKIYNKGKLISQRGLTSAYSDNIPDKEFRDHIDDFFMFLTDI